MNIFNRMGQVVRGKARIRNARWFASNLGENDIIHERYVAVDEPTIKALLSSYEWHPTAQGIHDEVLRAAIDFRDAKILDPRTDVEDLAKRAYVDLFNTGA